VNLNGVNVVPLRLDVPDQPLEMGRVARFALDVGVQALGGQAREQALVIDLDDVDLVLVEQLDHAEQRARPVLELDPKPREPAGAGEIAKEDVGKEARVDVAAG
jgi:hypothetical protein